MRNLHLRQTPKREKKGKLRQNKKILGSKIILRFKIKPNKTDFFIGALLAIKNEFARIMLAMNTMKILEVWSSKKITKKFGSSKKV